MTTERDNALETRADDYLRAYRLGFADALAGQPAYCVFHLDGLRAHYSRGYAEARAAMARVRS
jgi:hypothetical protein